ncbi:MULTISPECIES: hypothetical protein [unclassified Gordonia (in: high G+C Gram-positive bacteria)]|uniref:hypothetical protein n=1 Tax=Gordonia sp. B7-2 TaxID=3420932 RepID=UPI003D8D041F
MTHDAMSHKMIRWTAALGAVVVAVGLAGCGGTDESAGASSAAASPSGASKVSPPPSADTATTIDITIANGTVTPRNARIDATVGTPIVLYVTSDAADEVHVHSTPEHSFEVAAGAQRERFEFTVTVPGSVAVELHEADVTVATLQVR